MKIQSNFFNNAAFAVDSKYYPQVKYYRDNKSTEQIHYQLELFNNGCLKYSTLINRLARLCNDSKQAINGIIGQFLEPQTTVIFRKEKDGSILACFPYEIHCDYYNVCYMHVGQHSALNWDYLRQTKPCNNPDDYNDLKRELEQIGYNLTVAKKRNYNKYISAAREAMRINTPKN